MTAPSFSFIFARELHSRLLWFGRLRWGAVAFLASLSLVGPRIGLQSTWPSLFVIATFVSAYNVYFSWRLRAVRQYEYADLRGTAIRLIAADLAALTVTVHFTGGLQSPLLVFYTFHMAIGTIMIATRVMTVMAGLTSLGICGVYLLEIRGFLAIHATDPGPYYARACAFNLVALIGTMFGIILLTHSVSGRFKKRNIKLYRTTETLSQRTRELQQALQDGKDLERRKSHYMRISAHQLRSPLGTIKTSLQVLHEGYIDSSSERGRKLLDGISDRVDSLLDIVNDLLELAKIREGRGKAPWSRKININQLLADLFDSMGPLADNRGIEMVPDFRGVSILDWGIPPDLVYAFENLIHNAIKYSRQGGKVTVRLRHTGVSAVVRIIDEGIGIGNDHLEKIFLEFVRTPAAKQHAVEGTGLGLSVVKEVMEAHGGRVTVSSEEGRGSEFTVTLPVSHFPPEVENR